MFLSSILLTFNLSYICISSSSPTSITATTTLVATLPSPTLFYYSNRYALDFMTFSPHSSLPLLSNSYPRIPSLLRRLPCKLNTADSLPASIPSTTPAIKQAINQSIHQNGIYSLCFPSASTACLFSSLFRRVLL